MRAYYICPGTRPDWDVTISFDWLYVVLACKITLYASSASPATRPLPVVRWRIQRDYGMLGTPNKMPSWWQTVSCLHVLHTVAVVGTCVITNCSHLFSLDWCAVNCEVRSTNEREKQKIKKHYKRYVKQISTKWTIEWNCGHFKQLRNYYIFFEVFWNRNNVWK